MNTEYNQWANFKEGDFVAYRDHKNPYGYFRESLIFSTVKKVTKGMIVLENGQRFAASGRLWGYDGSKFSVPPYLMHKTAEDFDKYIQGIKKLKAQRFVDCLQEALSIAKGLGEDVNADILALRQKVSDQYGLELKKE